MTVHLTGAARRELGAQVVFLAAGSPDAARQLVLDVRRAFAWLAGGDVEGPEVQLRGGRRIGQRAVPPLTLFYELDGRDVVIRRVRYGARRPTTRR